MLISFQEQESTIFDCLAEVGEQEKILTIDELQKVKSLINTLIPIQTAVEILSKTNCSLLESEIIISTLIQELKQDNILGSCLSDQIKKDIMKE